MLQKSTLPRIAMLVWLGLMTGGAFGSDILWQYPPRPAWPLSEPYHYGVGFDLSGYARWQYGSTASAFLVANNAYGWRIKYYQSGAWRTVGIDMLRVSYWQGIRIYGSARIKNWGVYYDEFNNPYSWKGAYLVSIL